MVRPSCKDIEPFYIFYSNIYLILGLHSMNDHSNMFIHIESRQQTFLLEYFRLGMVYIVEIRGNSQGLGFARLSSPAVP